MTVKALLLCLGLYALFDTAAAMRSSPAYSEEQLREVKTACTDLGHVTDDILDVVDKYTPTDSTTKTKGKSAPAEMTFEERTNLQVRIEEEYYPLHNKSLKALMADVELFSLVRFGIDPKKQSKAFREDLNKLHTAYSAQVAATSVGFLRRIQEVLSDTFDSHWKFLFELIVRPTGTFGDEVLPEHLHGLRLKQIKTIVIGHMEWIPSLADAVSRFKWEEDGFIGLHIRGW